MRKYLILSAMLAAFAFPAYPQTMPGGGGSGGGGGTGCNPGGSNTNVLTDNGSGACNSDANAQLVNGALSLGSSGTAGSVSMGNTTSGTAKIQPAAGALGSTVATLPAGSDTITENAQTQTLTNKTISGSSNTLSNIGNASLTNSSITIGGQATSLGGSTTNQGNGGKIQLSTGTTITNDCVKYDANGNTVDAGSACGGGGGSGTVTEVDTGACLTGGPITTTGTVAGTYVINAQTGTSYTIQASDACKLVTFSNGSSIAVTLPQATGSFAAGYSFDVQNKGAGVVTITPTTSTINGASTLTISQNTGVTIVSDGANYQVSSCTACISSGAGTVTTTGSPANGNLTKFTGSTSISNGDLSGDCTTSGTLAITCLKTNGTSFGTAAVKNTGTSGANVPLMNAANVWSAQQSNSVTTLSISTATFTPDGSNNNYKLTLVHASCPCTLANPSATPVAGTSGVIQIIQSSTGSDTIGTWGSQYIYPGGTSTISLSSGANAQDFLSYFVIDSTHILLSTAALNASH